MQKRLLLAVFASFLSSFLFAQNNTAATPQWRPVYHFTPAKNWTNDPNGLIYVDGKYQLYYQHNPFENQWGHMSWGHASSTDLLHWQHYPVAMPEKTDNGDTTWRFSGCVVNDKNNTSGFCKNGGCLVAVYTAHSPNRKNESQYIAYSNDGGMSYTDYDKNPVIDLGKTDFRDPNVQWDEQNKRWLMVVALPLEHAVRFYSSPNLKDWTLLSEFGSNQGYSGHPWECPSLLQMPVDGDEANKKWVLFVSCGGPEGGPFMQYFIGNFDGTTFISHNPGTSYLTVDEGNTFYAAISYNDAPQNKNIMVGWMVPLKTGTSPWRGQMSIPRDLSLRTTADGIRLFQQPSSVVAKRISTLPAKQQLTKSNVSLINKELAFSTQPAFNTNAYWIEATFIPNSATDVGFTIAQQKGGNGTIINYNVATNELTVKPAAGDEIHPLKAVVQPVEGKIKLQVLFDKSSLEVFANDGEKAITTYIFPPKDATQFSAFAKGGTAILDTLKVYSMQ
ncbi:glycoside hydrolase family 32 protein [Ilyomonas limi]|uniref:Glycoside hydrolase family 32 protein n=1 Tax=Ilyomonas limi TaxID=2575867 RepID=A0A4U3L1C5_9BACT|nr:glycoside hydrolase family 32 protein [Ilyomonas limi]TKK68019.1 glycoside hydrolase family 32 protein [Ilyomonas limi]